MKFVIQRVSKASVTAKGSTVGSIGRGFLVLAGIGSSDKIGRASCRERV